MMEILHARSICETDREPLPPIGTPATARSHSVVCNECGRAGSVATPGNEEVVREQWAIRNGYNLVREDGQWVVTLSSRRST